MASALDAALVAFRADLGRREKAALAQVNAAYTASLTRLTADANALEAKVDAARAAGVPVSSSWLVTEARYTALIAQVRTELVAVNGVLRTTLGTLRADGVRAALRDAPRLLRIVTGRSEPDPGNAFDHLNTAAVRELLGALSAHSPLTALLQSRAGDTAGEVAQALTHALITGRNPRRAAAEIRRIVVGDQINAHVIARTELYRAYRTAAVQSYRDNPAVTGWRWMCLHDRVCCAACWAMDGTEHGPAEPFASHPCCRCTPVPVVPMSTVPLSGAARFATLDPADQLAILGPGKYAAYTQGLLTLDDDPRTGVVVSGTHPVWGQFRRERALRDIAGADAVPALIKAGQAAR